MQRRAPNAARGRVLGLYMMMLGVIYPIGSLIEGAIAHVVGIRAVTVVSGRSGARDRHGGHRRCGAASSSPALGDARRPTRRRRRQVRARRSALGPVTVSGHPDGVETLEPGPAEEAQRRVAGTLDRLGIGRGDRVVFCLESSASLLVCVLGAARRGVVPVLLNATQLGAERAALIADAEPALVVDDPSGLTALLSGPGAELAPYPLVRPMHYTSGTTGRPKGVWSGELDEAEAQAQLDDEADLWDFGPGDTHLVCSPMYHSVSVRLAGAALLRGGRVMVLPRFDAAAAGVLAEQVEPTTTFMAPTVLQRASGGRRGPVLRLAAPPRPRRLAVPGRAGSGPPWCSYGPVCCGSSTDRPRASSRCAHPTSGAASSGTVGRARPGRRLEVDADGVVWCHAPRFARFEYWRDPPATARAWRGDAFTVGDLGRLDEDGYLFLEGRRDDLIITGGVNVYPVEVEAVLAEVAGCPRGGRVRAR